MDLKNIEEVVSRIQGKLFKNSNSYSIGMLKSHFKGTGLQFKEHQVYCHGDDVRFIDWKLLARTNNPYVKTFEEERNVEIVVIVDLSRSMFMGLNGVSKAQAAINIACLLSLLAKETNDYVQVSIIKDREIILPRGSGKKAIVYIISELRKHNILNEDGSVNIDQQDSLDMPEEQKLKVINKYLGSRKEVVILSDFNSLVRDEDLSLVINRKNSHCFRIVAPLDKNLRRSYSIFGESISADNSQKGFFSIKANKSVDGLKKTFGNRIHILDLENRYMEDFVKELI